MSGYPNLKTDDVELLKTKTKDDQLKELQYKTEKHDHENILKSLKTDSESYKNKYKSLNKKKVLLIITEIIVESGSAIDTSTMSLLNPSVGIVLTSSTALLTSVAILITKEFISKLKTTKLRDWINVITLLYEKTLKELMIDKKINEEESEQLKQIYNHYIVKKTEIRRSTQFKVEDVFTDFNSKATTSTEQITNLNNFSAKMI